jgi:nucleoside-diphosphate-sugar epimerase
MARSELPFRIEGRRVWVAGHRGMVGSALVRRLAREDCQLLTVERDRVDLRRQAEVEAWIHDTKPEVVVGAAARVGGIHANASRPADFIDDNLTLQTNVIHCAARGSNGSIANSPSGDFSKRRSTPFGAAADAAGNRMKAILVTGGAGVGSHACKALSRAGYLR